ncbi:hypothetical protein [Aquitalea pelogenes]|uniref:hypothetical protein n=1 Tax=Aquitalea pelogenes TaxID=1293573 RepID=UPI00128FB5F2|nr:hypothetical protein [Aquitalea pelogenes]
MAGVFVCAEGLCLLGWQQPCSNAAAGDSAFLWVRYFQAVEIKQINGWHAVCKEMAEHFAIPLPVSDWRPTRKAP